MHSDCTTACKLLPFEVGGAFLIASYTVRRGHFKARDAEGYGLGLALWENGLYIGALTLIDYIIYYAILSSGSSSGIAQTLYSALSKDAPALFYPSSGALPLVGYAILERVTSLLGHFSWGLLCVLAAVYRKKIYFLIALPMGFLIDFFVPFSGSLGLGLNELILFVISLASLAVALRVYRGTQKENETGQASSPKEARAAFPSLIMINFKRSINYGRIYLILGIAISLIIVVATAFLPSTPQTQQYIASEGKALGITNAGALVIVSIYPVISPLFAVIGSLGALMIFVSDKGKGVYEYLISYGIETS